MAVTIDLIRQLRQRTDASIMDCKEALVQADGDLDKAIGILRERGAAIAAKKTTRPAKEGIVESYIHLDRKIGVLVEVNCETDFVARNDDFKRFVKDIALQVAAQNPLYLRRERIPKEVIDRETEALKVQVKGKPEKVVEKIVSGRLEKFYQEICLLEQPFIRDQSITIRDYLTSMIGKIGENIVIRRFVRYQLGEDEKAEACL